MFTASSKIIRLLLQLGSLFILYSACRLLFLLFNKSYFPQSHSFLSSAMLFIHGLRFDVAAIFMVNALFIVLSLLPLRFTSNKHYLKGLKYLFIITNSFFLLLNIIDVAYFPFVQKRMQYDVFDFVNGKKGNEFFVLMPIFLKEYWHLWLCYILLVVALVKGYGLGERYNKIKLPSLRDYGIAALIFIVSIGASIVAIRGGFQVRPLDIIHAAEVADAQQIPVVLNSPFSVIKTAGRKRMESIHYFPDSALSKCDKGIHTPAVNAPLRKLNIVIIIVESLSREYVGYFGGSARTPFLDSLFSHSLVCTNGFANARESIQGIPAILAGIPACQDEPFILSPYASDRITSIPNLLKPLGYTSAFFHGGNTGTMGFSSFCKLAGINNYYGREDYNNEKDFDGDWGIWDEPFLQYVATKLPAMQQPFCASVFTLNTHHPFKVPEKYKERFKQEGHPILSCVSYVDYALSKFFERIKKEPWFENTVFVITADHAGPLLNNNHMLDSYRIPIAFYKPDNSLQSITRTVANQIDILPTLMRYINYPSSFFSFGRSIVNETCDRFAINYNAGVYQYIDSLYCYRFAGKPMEFYKWTTDSLFKQNLVNNNLPEMKIADERTKKFIQNYNNRVSENKMTAQ